jgi:hypothetical protein
MELVKYDHFQNTIMVLPFLPALLGFDGYINVHLSADKLALLLRKATLDKTTLPAYRKYIHWEALLLLG